MNVVQTNLFKKAIKKLHSNQKAELDKAVKAIMQAPDIGQSKTGDLTGVLVYKFKMVKQLTLLAYTYHDQTITLALLALGTHENFYRDLKKSL
jgi:mRNA-degrading endonuclease YafQ of YafQ-DinJ toxin-antitoxin module